MPNYELCILLKNLIILKPLITTFLNYILTKCQRIEKDDINTFAGVLKWIVVIVSYMKFQRALEWF